MKVLQLCLRIPYPAIDGGNIAMLNTAMALHAAGCDVSMLAVNTRKHYIEHTKLPEFFFKLFDFRSVYIDNSVTISGAIKNLFSSRSYNIERFISKNFENELIRLLNEQSFDVVLVESLFMLPYLDTIRNYSKAKVVLHAHNVEHIIWHRLRKSESNFLRRIYLTLLANRLEKYEKAICKKLDAIIALTPDDERLFSQFTKGIKLFSSPIGLDVAKYINNNSENNPVTTVRLFHLGSMDWMPNLEAVDWFIKNVWQQLSAKFPDIELHLAGNRMPDYIFKQADAQLKVYGRIEIAKEFTADKNIMIVPLLSGSGMRIKIIEGMASGKCIVSTTIGAEGISYTDGVNIFIADTPQQFIEKISMLYSNKSLVEQTGQNAYQHALAHYDINITGKQMKDMLSEISQ